MTDLSRRAIAQEQMDAVDLPQEEYAAVLADLARANFWTLAARPTLDFLKEATGDRKMLRLLDVGFGQGDMLRRISRWAERRGIEADLVGVDLNPGSAPAARLATPAGSDVTYITGDYGSLAGQNWDVIISSLVAHHMSETELLAFLRFMDAEAKAGWFVNDLHRHRIAYRGYPVLARLMRWHRIVRQDGTLSIARAFRPSEWRQMLRRADIEGARVRRYFPFRLCVARIR